MKTIVKGESTGKWLERDMYLAYLPHAPKCFKCENSGYYSFLDHPGDDLEVDYCQCPFGSALMIRDAVAKVASKKRV